jgi:hypothetical protein
VQPALIEDFTPIFQFDYDACLYSLEALGSSSARRTMIAPRIQELMKPASELSARGGKAPTINAANS